MSAITALVLGSLTYALAPVPPEASPDPMGRGYLGITLGEGVVIERVEPGKPAARAGLQSGDVIVRVGTLQPNNYSEVIAHVCSYRPGALVEIEVRRGSERKTFKVKLGVRPPELDGPPIPPDEPIP